MTEFRRSFPVKLDPKETPKWTQYRWVEKLFSYWTLPGKGGGNKALRIGIRDGYLNFYIKGQSVAKLTLVREEPSIALSKAYVDGLKKGVETAELKPGGMRRFSAHEPCADNIDQWIDTALSYAGDEKRFVDDLVAVNAHIIDLEMALSTPHTPQGRKLSRMDIVVVQRGVSAPQIAFWEAKCAINPELRAQEDIVIAAKNGKFISGAKVAEQIYDYEYKMQEDAICQRIGDQYREAAKILCGLCKIFGKGDPPEEWTMLPQWEGLVEVIRRPGLVIGNYRPDGSESQSDFISAGKSFEEKHRGRLNSCGITIKTYSSPPLTENILPALPMVDPRP